MPAEDGRGQVADGEEVHGAGKGDTRDAVEGGADPGDLWAVDGEMRGDGAVAALGGEDRGAGLLRDGFGGGRSVEEGVSVLFFLVGGLR